MMIRSLALAMMLLTQVPIPAQAMDIRGAKEAGLVGERPDGLVGAVGGDESVAALVSRINEARLAKYNEIARRNGTTPQAVQIIAGRELAAKTPSGHFVMDEAGVWRKK
ncbi:MAG: YdbL family protein [Alphaproteobacteria bacterium]|nr:YdbL family protein [Alphaproteobacteria bacterium]MBF0129939.1 YdbL family protein [Alphaproteobacteria bacterium]